MKVRRLAPYLFLVSILALVGVMFWQREWVGDWFRLRGYTAPAAVSVLAADTALTPYGQRLLYVNHPSIEERTAFNRHCADHMEHSAVLGCYHGNRQGIYIYNVTDARLRGVQQVTVAHEMLHQAYDRLSPGERKRVAGLLQDYYVSGSSSQSIKDRIDLYKQAGTADLANEMHSIFGTEVRNLPPVLETYYQQYFTDRTKVVAFSEQYQAEFTKREQQVDEYDKQLAALKTQIEASEKELNSLLATIRTRESVLKQEEARGDVASYNRDARTYNALVDSYNAKVTALKASIHQYNDIVSQRNAIASVEQELQQALDSQLSPVSVQ